MSSIFQRLKHVRIRNSAILRKFKDKMLQIRTLLLAPLYSPLLAMGSRGEPCSDGAGSSRSWRPCCSPRTGRCRCPCVAVRAAPWERKTSVADPEDPYVYRPPGSGSISTWYGSGFGSGSFYHQAKIGRKTFLATILCLLYDFLSLM